jgi:GT2 family glycosyltransferase
MTAELAVVVVGPAAERSDFAPLPFGDTKVIVAADSSPVAAQMALGAAARQADWLVVVDAAMTFTRDGWAALAASGGRESGHVWFADDVIEEGDDACCVRRQRTRPDWSPSYVRHTGDVGHVALVASSIVTEDASLRLGDGRHIVHDLVWNAWTSGLQPRHLGAAVGVLRAGDDHRPSPVAVRPGHRSDTVTMVIPTAGRVDPRSGDDQPMVLRLLNALRSFGTKFHQIVLVDDQHRPLSDVVRRVAISQHHAVVHSTSRQQFNFSAQVNLGVSHATGEFVLIANDDVMPLDGEWLARMLAECEADVGAVTPVLLYANGQVQCAGHFHGGSPFIDGQWLTLDELRSHPRLSVPHEASSASAAWMLTPRRAFLRAGGMAEELPNSFNDVDYCCKLRHLGYRVVVTPGALLEHVESASRDPSVNRVDVGVLMQRWRAEFTGRDRFAPSGHTLGTARAVET